MEQAFLDILDRALLTGWMIAAVIALRILFKKAPKWTICLLWGLVAARLAFPFQPESALSLMPNKSAMTVSLTESDAPEALDLELMQAAGVSKNPVLKQWDKGTDSQIRSNPLWIKVCSIVWMLGTAIMALYAVVSYARLRKKVSPSIPVLEDAYICDDLKTPFIFGIFRPKIYLPSGIDADMAQYVLTHERMHLKRWDHIWKPFGFYVLSVYWFHPLCWVAYLLFCRDIEYACDEKAIRHMDKSQRADYCQALLCCSAKKKRISACPVAFGETGVKERIRSALYYKKPAFWLVAASALASVLVAVCFLTNPIDDKNAGRKSAAHEKEDSAQNKRTGGAANEDQKEPANERLDKRQSESVASIVAHAKAMSKEGYQEAAISYVDNAKVGWDYFSQNPWGTKKRRELLAQAALRELYTLTGCQVKECVYTTDGRSRFIFWKSEEEIRRSTAFYSRDYGWTLAGDSTPHMGFVNARRVWYSDIQQLDSPYQDPQFQGHGAIPVWFLTHSGVYQGEKIKGFDVYDVEDTVFSHVKLLFDGGYYVVVDDDDIESCAEVYGPYYDQAGEDGPDYGADCLGLPKNR